MKTVLISIPEAQICENCTDFEFFNNLPILIVSGLKIMQ